MAAYEPYNRNSNALRASVLDAALQLGIGSSRTVENWMFNSVTEEDEEEPEDAPTPALTSTSTTSEESSPSFSLPTVTGRPDTAYTEEWKAHIAHPQDAHLLPAASPAKPASKSKLRKPRKDGYESDGGYVSESGRKDKAKKKEKEKKSKKGKDTDGTETEMESDGEHLSGMKKKKSKKEKKSKKDDDGYDTSDGGYLSEASGGKKKRSFFRLGSKSKKSAAVPATPVLPPSH
ncbi:hypothetical protein EVG20_g2423 [Dentipellis fragilis]|uniref:Uncharacterized protein n=1 Tax=Dentipellis fragilis TaxID=205917 RepID=A0A4Y9Z999_9AGAM|nr:hypothetical protein EVG20_g2423 [Dentipellis fragilis]